MGASFAVGCQDQLAKRVGYSCTAAAPCCKESDKDFDVEHTNPPTGAQVIRVFALHDDENGMMPVGLVLEESLQHLQALDKQLILFAAGSNLPAVRWFLHLGASVDVCDANGSTCLHAACRTGSTQIVSELLRRRAQIEAADHAYWTPLHIAAHMGRPEVVSRLLQARANPNTRNAWGHTAMQLCLNATTQSMFMQRPVACSTQPDEEAAAVQDGIDQVEGEPEWWFINPEPALKNTYQFHNFAGKIAALLFNRRPTHGLAFLVAAGVAENYASALQMLLAESETSRLQVGSFLGESLSMCNAMRFGVFDSMPFMSTGVITALTTGFSSFTMPADMQKVHRLVQGVALAWWRHHQYWITLEANAPEQLPAQLSRQEGKKGDELVGLQLLQYVASCSVLSQLMFSTVMLHWFVHRDGRGVKQAMAFEIWTKLNKGIENGGNDVPEHLQRKIYDVILQRFLPCLDLTPAFASNDEAVCVDALQSQFQASTLTPLADIESPVHLLDDALSKFARTGARASNTGELSTAVFLGEQVHHAPDALSMSTVWPGGQAIATLATMFLFFAMPESPAKSGKAPKQAVPSALTDARRLRVEGVDDSELIITFIAAPLGAMGISPHTYGIPLLFLLPDGRWQQVNLTKLRMKFASSEELTLWQNALAKYANYPLPALAEARAQMQC